MDLNPESDAYNATALPLSHASMQDPYITVSEGENDQKPLPWQDPTANMKAICAYSTPKGMVHMNLVGPTGFEPGTNRL